MLFNSLPFLYFFLPISWAVFHLNKNKEFRYVWMTACGYVFYSFWNWKFTFLMLFSTLVSYLAGLGMLSGGRARRRLCLVLPITVDLLLLGFFKYANFTLSSVAEVTRWLDVPTRIPAWDIILPVGISFYTFHTITYIVDSYRGVITPTRNFFEFSCYVSLFPQLIAGPIVRFRQIEADLEDIGRDDRTDWMRLGWSFFVIGMIKKVLIADPIATMIDPALARYQSLSTGDAWLCVLGYTYQLYFDFSGYCDMAVGLGYLFGLRLPQNFNSPYKAVGFADFWRRWHISLSTCLRDYLYIPLGGSRGTAWQTHRNLMITMLLGGLWHGANWTFVFWGGYHGLLLILERVAGTRWDACPRILGNATTMLLVVIGWVFFRSDTFGMATTLLRKMFIPSADSPGLPTLPWSWSLAVMLLIAGGVAHLLPNSFELDHEWGPVATAGFAALFALALFMIYGARPSPFLYFQF
jgi:alginate O-acetyltransferase complex protein AlgI